jgi:hypothetical protein
MSGKTEAEEGREYIVQDNCKFELKVKLRNKEGRKCKPRKNG